MIITSLSSFYLIKKESISFKNIVSALGVSGISFSRESIKTMLPYLKRNLDSYEEMRGYPLSNNDSPSLKFTVTGGEENNLLFHFEEKKVSLPKSKKEIAPSIFVRRINIPIMHIYGKSDGFFRYEDSFVPWKKLIGTNPKDLFIIELDKVGHGIPKDTIIKSHLSFLKKYH